nr:NADP-dependent isocitrate dehydrogenase [Aeromicrobium sp.]
MDVGEEGTLGINADVRYLDVKGFFAHPNGGVAALMAKIIYTHTDEAPALATYSFLPVIEAYASTAGVEVETRDISL